MRLPSALPLLAGLLAVYLIAPFLAGIGQAGLADWRGVDAGQLFDAAAVSVGSATLATVLVAIGGVPLGYVLARRRGRGFALLGFVVQLPLALPPLASGTLLLFLVGYASPIGRWTDGALTDSFAGIVLAEAFVSGAVPDRRRPLRVYAAVDPVLEDVAATLGHGPWAVFRRVSLALSTPCDRRRAAADLAARLRRVRRHRDACLSSRTPCRYLPMSRSAARACRRCCRSCCRRCCWPCS